MVISLWVKRRFEFDKEKRKKKIQKKTNELNTERLVEN